jgi:sulfatase modifying factor 1
VRVARLWAVLVGPALLGAACHYDPVLPDGVLACQVAEDCPTPGDRCVPLPDHLPAASVCCHDCPPPDADPTRVQPLADAAVDAPEPDGPEDGPSIGVVIPPLDAAPRLDAAALLGRDAPAAADSAPACPPSRGGPALVKVGSFCIDATEVTNAQYAVFWTARAAGRDVAGQIPACSWNVSFTPDTGGATWPFRAGTEQRPVVNVDWCDAYAFCQWAGKRLCGSTSAMPLQKWDLGADPLRSQWSYACSSGGSQKFPYGNEYDPAACNTGNPVEATSSSIDVGTRARCRTEAGVYDLSGNVEEWVDACTGDKGPDDECAVLGQSAYQGTLQALDFSCAASGYGDPRSVSYQLRGFRCCAP